MAKQEATLLLKVKQSGEKVISNISAGIAKIGKVSLGIFTAIGASAGVALRAWRGQELAVNQLNQSLIQQGIFSKKLSSEYQTMAAQLQKVTQFGDEAIISAQAQLQAYLGQEKITKDLTKAVLDFSAAQGVDLKTAAGLVGKAIGSSTNALSRYGIEIDAGASKQEKMAQVVGALTSRFGGQAEAAAQGVGKIQQLKNRFGDILELIGKALVPAFDYLVGSVEDFFSVAEKTAESNPFAEFARQTLIVLEEIKFGFNVLGKTIGTIVGFWVESISKVVGPIAKAMEGDFSGAFSLLKNNAQSTLMDIKGIFENGFDQTQIVQNVTESQEQLNKNIASINAKFAQQRESERIKEEEQIRASNQRKLEIQIEQNQQEILMFEENLNKRLEVENQKKQERLALVESGNIQEQEKLAQHERIMADTQKRQRLVRLNNNVAIAKTEQDRLQAMREKELFLENEANQNKKKNMTQLALYRQQLDAEQVRNAQNVFSQIEGLSQSNSTTLNRVAQAAAIANILINTARGVMLAQATFPPPFGQVAGAAIAAAGAIQVAKVRGVQLADGGIVKATEGGIPAIIGEGGRDEAVIPLDEAGGIGQPIINVNVYGGLLGDDQTARELAIAIDKKLFELRKDNASVAFDQGIL